MLMLEHVRCISNSELRHVLYQRQWVYVDRAQYTATVPRISIAVEGREIISVMALVETKFKLLAAMIVLVPTDEEII